MLKKLGPGTNAINWFDIPVTNLNRAKKFYETILDIKMEVQKTDKEEMAFFPRMPDTIMATSGIVSGSITTAAHLKPGQNGAVVYFNATPSLQNVLEKVEGAGGKILSPSTKIPAGYIAICLDTEGNKIGLHAEK